MSTKYKRKEGNQRMLGGTVRAWLGGKFQCNGMEMRKERDSLGIVLAVLPRNEFRTSLGGLRSGFR